VACDAQTFVGVDASKWALVKEMIGNDYGIRVESDRGEASTHGFTLRWSYDVSARTLEIQCSKKPFFVSCGVINGRIAATADRCGITAG
jgi:hypothetical protein